VYEYFLSFIFVAFPGITFKQLRTIFLGDLSKTEAVKCFKHFIKVIEAPLELFPSEADFDKVYYLTGGRIAFINEYVSWAAKFGSLPTGKHTHVNP
jgi:hypothetical protein